MGDAVPGSARVPWLVHAAPILTVTARSRVRPALTTVASTT